MKGKEIRKKFINFFKDKGHKHLPSSSLIPADDPTLLFTNAGMVQFKKIFLGQEKPAYSRAVTCQKCVRAGGKHNDLENVGYTARHHTFFEMLGNFSFGDYFKEEAISFAWEFITKELGLDKKKIYVTVFKEDEEAREIWKKVAGLPEERIVPLGEKDNFWMMGDTGPCGPCSEIIYDQGEQFGCGRPDCGPGCDCDRFLEIWNLVFMQYERDEKGNLRPLPKGCIDTGMGLERIAAVMQGVPSNYDTDLFKPIMKKIEEISGKGYKENEETEVAFKVIADHVRAATFLIAEGLIPSNEGRGYVLRRIIRRAQRFGKILGIGEPFLFNLVDSVIQEYGEIYPEIQKEKENIKKILKFEEEKFLNTLETGLEILEREVEELIKSGQKIIPGEVIFKLYDTYGFPYDLVRDYALKKGLEIDLQGFERLRAQARELSRKSWKGEIKDLPQIVKEAIDKGIEVEFTGYEKLEEKSKVLFVGEEGKYLYVITEKTPFYPEGGGQVADRGEIIGKNFKGDVIEVKRSGKVIFHKVLVKEGGLSQGEEVILKVDKEKRESTARHHTATHLLHAALRKVLGSHVHQAGSLVSPERLRFDFTHFKGLTPEELERIEKLINEWIMASYPVETFYTSREEAEKLGAIALFEEKYGEVVRVVKINEVSIELCGGTHVKNTGEIGLFKILGETSVASGVRRIEAVCGLKALEYMQNLEKKIYSITEILKCSPEDIEKRIESLFSQVEELKREVKRLKKGELKKELEEALKGVKKIDKISYLVAKFQVKDMNELREIGDYFKNKLPDCVVFLIGQTEKKILALCMLSKNLAERLSAREIFESLSSLGLKGGGREHLAQGSFLSMPELGKIEKALETYLAGKIAS